MNKTELTGGILEQAMAISGQGNIRSVRGRDVYREMVAGRRLYSDTEGVGATWSFRLWLDSVTPSDVDTIRAYCERQGQEAPALLSFYQPSRETSKTDQSASGWKAKRVKETGEEAVAFTLEYRATGCTVERTGPIYRVKVDGVEVLRFSAFSVSDGRLARWANVTGSPLQSALKESRKEEKARIQGERTDKLGAIQAGMLKAVREHRAQGAEAEELAGIYPEPIIAEVYADLAQGDEKEAAAK